MGIIEYVSATSTFDTLLYLSPAADAALVGTARRIQRLYLHMMGLYSETEASPLGAIVLQRYRRVVTFESVPGRGAAIVSQSDRAMCIRVGLEHTPDDIIARLFPAKS